MPKTQVAELFLISFSQAILLPVEFQFDCSHVYATRDEGTGDVVPSSQPDAQAWRDFFETMDKVDVPDEFMRERPMNIPPKVHSVFDEER